MALVYSRVATMTQTFIDVGKTMATLKHRVDEALAQEAALGIDYGAADTPEYIIEDEVGNMNGFEFTRQEMDLAIKSMQQYQALMIGNVPNVAQHLSRLNVVVEPTV